MFALTNLVQKAQQFIDPTQGLNLSAADRNPSKASLFQAQFRLPASQNPLYEINAELTIPPTDAAAAAGASSSAAAGGSRRGGGDDGADPGWHYVGKLYLSEQYMCFSTTPSSFLQSATTAMSSAFTGQTHGGGPSGNGFTFPLCSIRRVERLNSQQFQFSLSIATWNGFHTQDPPKQDKSEDAPPKKELREQRIMVHLGGSRQSCERFCDGLKKGLRAGVANVPKMRRVVAECYSEYLLRSEDRKDATPPDAGLGMVFRYPGDPKKLRDRAKMRLWAEYLRDNGRNVTVIRQPTFHKLIRVGLPNRLRGEMWEVASGSLYLRLESPTLYADTLAKFEGRESLAIDEIEKDLNRSLPEYAGFQSDDGIGRLRRVLTAYSWVNADVGYCQAMNIVVAALLIYMSEAQAFFLLSTLCDRLVPGYYSITMYGTLLDQKVFESLVEKTMPILWEHLVKSDVQLSVVSLPWFLSLYVNSMPLVFAFRVLDVFFVEGPKVLFQVGLAILRINGEELLDATDDGAFISVLKSYFARLDESAHPKSENPKLRAVTRFQELMVVAFKEFSGITHSSIMELRLRNKGAVLDNIEIFARRTAIRNLGPDSKILSVEELGALYNRFYNVLHEREQRARVQEEAARKAKLARARASQVFQPPPSLSTEEIERGRVGLGASTSLMDYDAFREFLAVMAKWALSDSPATPRRDTFSGVNSSPWGGGGDSGSNSSGSSFRNGGGSSSKQWPEPAEHEFMRRLFKKWDVDKSSMLTLQNVVTGLARIKGKRDIMGTITYFFELYDDDGDGKVDREGILRISEALLFLSRRGLEGIQSSDASSSMSLGAPEAGGGPGASPRVGTGSAGNGVNDRFLDSVSGFIRRCFEYADPDHPSNAGRVQVERYSDGDEGEGVAGDDAFAIGDDEDEEDDESEDEDLLIGSPQGSPKLKAARPDLKVSTDGGINDDGTRRRASKVKSEAANAALDPAHPLHMTLPTFRMVVLADELLEQFFESAFPASFHIIEGLQVQSPTTGALTTFSNMSGFGFGGMRAAAGAAGAGPGQGRGLRGVLDGIVTDGMRVAAEVRRRMEEAQRELEKNATPAQRQQQQQEEEEDDDDVGMAVLRASSSIPADRRSVKSSDRDLLDGADAEAGAMDRETEEQQGSKRPPAPLLDLDGPESESQKRVVEFEG